MKTLTDQILTKLSTGPAFYEALRSLGEIKALNAALIQLQADGRIVLTRAGYELAVSA